MRRLLGFRNFNTSLGLSTKPANVNSFSLRTHTCGELRLNNAGEKVQLYGWLEFKRMNRFLVLRDSYGSVQVKIPEEKAKEFADELQHLTYESAIRVTGLVVDRGQNRNAKMETGFIEIVMEELEILNAAKENLSLKTKVEATEKTRLTNRHLDLRSEKMQTNLRLRSKVVHEMRKSLVDKYEFVEVETPTLAQWTPGGAHEFPVPCSSPFKGQFYSLPQSPQIFKQILMCGGIDRYFQMARCYRDEGGKPDRQPEFTQVDLEISFSSQDEVLNLIESIIVDSWPHELTGLCPKRPFPRLTYADAMNDYGIDKPDLRIRWKLFDCTEELRHCSIIEESDDWRVIAFVVPESAKIVTNSMKKEWKRLLEMKDSTNQISNPAKKYPFKGFNAKRFISKYSIGSDDLVVFCWGKNEQYIRETLGQLRNYLGECIGLRSKLYFNFAWIVDFPLFVKNSEGQLESAHHPFTAPMPEYLEDLQNSTDLLLIKAQHYDLVMNGAEVGGGSVRIHNAELQKHVLDILNLPLGSLAKFVEALSNGAPPHAGFALGLDRYIALLSESGDSKALIRDVIAFPKTKDGKCLMMDSPAKPPQELLDRYGIKVEEDKID